MNSKNLFVRSCVLFLSILFVITVFLMNSQNINTILYIIGVLFLGISFLDYFIFIKNRRDFIDKKYYVNKVEELKSKVMIQKDEIKELSNKYKYVSEELKYSLNSVGRIQNELELKNEELQVLRKISEIITSTFDLNIIVKHLYEVFNKFTECDRCFICLPDKKTEELVCKYEFGEITCGEVGKVYNQDSSIKACFENGKTNMKTNVFIKSRNGYGDKMSIPLYFSNELMGVIFIESGKPGNFSNLNIKFLESLAIYAAIAINNAELFYSTYLQKQEIESLYEETAAVNEELSSYIDELNDAKQQLNIKNKALTKYYNEIQTGYFQTVMALANSIEAKDAYTRGHCQRVMEIACEIAQYVGMTDNDINKLKYCAILHDIGKIGISADILNKKGKLTPREYEQIKKHPLISYNILKDIEFLREGLDIILQHHERFDGKGYPYGLKGNKICKLARILCIADAFDAMTSDRPYRKAMTIQEAVNEIKKCKGTQFDPKFADDFIKLINSAG